MRATMNVARNLLIAVLMTVVTTLLFGVAYPLVVTGLAQMMFPDKANGQLLVQHGRVIGSRTIGQTFTAPEYFHGRPSAAGTGYDAASSGGTNLGPTNKILIDAVKTRVAAERSANPSAVVPIDLVTSSASGLDPHLSPAAAFVQISRVAAARRVGDADVRTLVESRIEGRQFGILGEPRVNVLLLNLALDDRYPRHR
jgi:K+-transporting ATPase ATPase C chain